VEVSLGIFAALLDGPIVARQRVIQTAQLLQDDAQVDVRFGQTRLDVERPPITS
jgi:hypothetical protein